MISVKRLLAATCLLAAAVSTGMADTWEPPKPRDFTAEGVSSRWWAQQATFAFSSDGKHFVIALKWSQGLPENLKGIKEYLDSIKVAAVQLLIHILESLPDRVIMVDLASGKLEGGS